MWRPGSLAAFGLAALALALAGCGSSGPKRTVDARAEALRFFTADAPLVALVDTEPDESQARAELASAFAGDPTWEKIRADAVARLRAAGVSDRELRSLLNTGSTTADAGLPPSQLAVGMEPPTTSADPAVLTVLVTDKVGRLTQIFANSAAAGLLDRSGSLDEALIYTRRDAAFAIRDGVMLAGSSAKQLRAAIMLRDGDRDGQLDDAAVRTLLDELPIGAPLVAYADFAELRRRDPMVAAVATREPWTRVLGKVALSLRSEAAGPVMDVFSELDPGADSGGVLPESDGRGRYEVSVPEVRRALGGEVTDSTRLGRLSIAAAPLAAAATVTDDELRAKLLLSP